MSRRATNPSRTEYMREYMREYRKTHQEETAEWRLRTYANALRKAGYCVFPPALAHFFQPFTETAGEMRLRLCAGILQEAGYTVTNAAGYAAFALEED